MLGQIQWCSPTLLSVTSAFLLLWNFSLVFCLLVCVPLIWFPVLFIFSSFKDRHCTSRHRPYCWSISLAHLTSHFRYETLSKLENLPGHGSDVHLLCLPLPPNETFLVPHGTHWMGCLNSALRQRGESWTKLSIIMPVFCADSKRGRKWPEPTASKTILFKKRAFEDKS